ncbi:FG-GAP repeat domain-containing protein [Ideonella paludis]|uniref:FG-GAP repeat domain-containing protein n=1 Tax=Ideonella paludis TaxID=1233411 RepID=UPI003624FDC5
MNSFQAETAKWTSAFMPEGTYQRGFYDFNGDGYKDYCALHADNLIRCTLTGPNGLVGAEVVTSSIQTYKYASAGASFVDINGDGNTDFCAPTQNGLGLIACVLSNGRSWAKEQVVLSVGDFGHEGYRWWTDINGDGAADYCRVPSTAAKPRSPTYDASAGDVYSTLSCRLGQIGADARVFGKSLFTLSDLVVTGVNFGAGTGLSFCSAGGNGFQTLCRVTNVVTPVTPVCTDNPNPNRPPICTPAYTNQTGFSAGIAGVNQASPALMRSLEDGLAAQTRVTYLSMSDARVYRRSSAGNGARQQLIQGTSPLVYESRAWLKQEGEPDESKWPPLTGTARYYYMDMMTDVVNGNRGFRERFMLTEGSNTIDHAVYFQGRGKEVDVTSRMDDPLEIGVAKLRAKFVIDPKSINVPAVANGASYRQRYLDAVMTQAAQTTTSTVNVPVWLGAAGWTTVPFTTSSTRLKRAAEAEANSDDGAFLLVQRSLNELADTVSPVGEVLPAGVAAINPRVRYVGKSSTAAFDLNGSTSIRLPSTIATSKQNAFGNVWEQVQTTQQTGTSQGTLEWAKTTTSTYADDYTKWNLGRMTGSTVVSTAPTADKQLSLFARSAGSSPNASTISGSGPTPPPPPPGPPAPLAPGVLSAILQLLLED